MPNLRWSFNNRRIFGVRRPQKLVTRLPPALSTPTSLTLPCLHRLDDPEHLFPGPLVALLPPSPLPPLHPAPHPLGFNPLAPPCPHPAYPPPPRSPAPRHIRLPQPREAPNTWWRQSEITFPRARSGQSHLPKSVQRPSRDRGWSTGSDGRPN